MSTGNQQDPLAKVETERRDFLKKIAIAAAFAAPTIATFSVDGMRKKAFAQAVYDQPEATLLPSDTPGRAVVRFSQPMNTSVGGDRSRAIGPCRTTSFQTDIGPYVWSWEGDTKQVCTFEDPNFCDGVSQLTVTFNWGNCGGSAKFIGANGQELVPFSGSVRAEAICT